MADWFTIIGCLLIGFVIGRFYPLYKKFLKFLDNENKNKTTI